MLDIILTDLALDIKIIIFNFPYMRYRRANNQKNYQIEKNQNQNEFTCFPLLLERSDKFQRWKPNGSDP